MYVNTRLFILLLLKGPQASPYVIDKLSLGTPGLLLPFSSLHGNSFPGGYHPARRAGELGAPLANPPFTTFDKDKVLLHLHPKFLSQVVSHSHLSQPIHLPTFFPKAHASNEEQQLHSLDSVGSWPFTYRG